jgi:putative DNA primase/helicase
MMAVENKTLKAALLYASLGWQILPLYGIKNNICECGNINCSSAGKHPRLKKGLHGATTDEKIIREWFNKWPDANIGIRTGEESGFFAFDIDPRHGGEDSYFDLESKYGKLPDTVESLTGGGGRHKLFKHPGFPVKGTVNLFPGIDIRGDGNYIVAPPSLHISGGVYQFEVSSNPQDIEIAPPPEWLLDVINGHKASLGGKKIKRVIDNNIPYRERNDTLASLAGSMKGRGRGFEEIFSALKKTNEIRCKPPLPEDEVEKIVNSICRYESNSQKLSFINIFKSESESSLTDCANSKRLIYYFGKQFLYNHTAGKYFIWDGTRWAEDKTRKIWDYAQSTVRNIYQDAAICEDTELRKKLADFARSSENYSRIKAMIELTKNNQNIAVTNEDLDQNIWGLNLIDGTYDLKSFTLNDHNPADKITKLCNVTFNLQAKSPLWEKFLDRIFKGNQTLINFMARAVGYSLTGDISEQCFFLCYGGGANGKSTFLNAILYILGDYAKQTPFDTILIKNGSSVRNDIAGLAGSRFVCAVEGEQGQRMAESVIKQLTGGDKVSARKLYQEYFEYSPTYKLWLATNHKPVIRGTDNAIWRRVKLIPFNVEIPLSEQDKELSEKLKIEASGIFNWAITGLKEWSMKGLDFPDEVEYETSNYREEMDTLSNYFSERCLEGEKLEISSQQLFEDYSKWCNENGEQPLSQRALGLRLGERNYQSIRVAGGRKGWKGIGLSRN